MRKRAMLWGKGGGGGGEGGEGGALGGEGFKSNQWHRKANTLGPFIYAKQRMTMYLSQKYLRRLMRRG